MLPFPFPYKSRAQQAGLTLIETMIGLVIASFVAIGGYQMMTRSQKYLAYKHLDQSSKTEISELTSIVKKDWDYRIRPAQPGIPGFALLSATNSACTNDCPKLRLWLNRRVGANVIVDVVTIENICRRPTDQQVRNIIMNLNFAASMETQCSTCPKGQIPAVKIEGIDMATGTAVLAAENRIFPKNASDPDKININAPLGMQTCFTQISATDPISIDVRSMFRDQSSSQLQVVQKTQVFPFDNFANIQLE